MSPIRPPVTPLPRGKRNASSTSTEASRGSESQSQRSHKRRKLSEAFKGLKIHVLEQRMSLDEITELNGLIERHGGHQSTMEHSTVIVTNLFVPGLLRPHLPNPLDGRDVVHPEWLRESARKGKRQPIEEYDRLTPELREELDPPLAKMPSSPHALVIVPRAKASDKEHKRPPWHKDQMYSCQRWTPLICPNEELVIRLRKLRELRRLIPSSGSDKMGYTAYGRVIASVKAYPLQLSLPLPKLPQVGESFGAQITEYLRTGTIKMADELDDMSFAQSRKLKALQELSSIYGIGPVSALEFYDGRRTGKPVTSIEELKEQCGDQFEAALRYMDDLALKIPRHEVQEIGELVNEHLQKVAPGAIYEIVGGYRRGKPESNDIDVVFTMPDGTSMRNVLDKLVKRLTKAGLIAHLINVFGGDSRRLEGTGHRHASHMDPLDKIFGVWRSKADGVKRDRDIFRRVDLIAVDSQYYWTAVMGWTGGTQFERDLRRVAALPDRGYKFDSGGITRVSDNSEVFVKSEEEIFELFGLKWIPPEFRNTD